MTLAISWRQTFDVVQHVPDQEVPPNNERQYPRQIAPGRGMFRHQGSSPKQPVRRQQAQANSRKVLFDFKGSVRGPQLHFFESGPDVEPVLRVQESTADTRQNEKDHDCVRE
jgi:hypothetical protein